VATIQPVRGQYREAGSTLISRESSFHQDLNGDGTIGFAAAPTTIEAVGSTSLVAGWK